jgi:hypothetical protein
VQFLLQREEHLKQELALTRDAITDACDQWTKEHCELHEGDEVEYELGGATRRGIISEIRAVIPVDGELFNPQRLPTVVHVIYLRRDGSPSKRILTFMDPDLSGELRAVKGCTARGH